MVILKRKIMKMKKSKKSLVKNAEMIDYEMKVQNKFPPDKLYPIAEQAKQDISTIDKKSKNQKSKKSKA